MKARSASTLVLDPYRAGAALGEALAPLEPEVVFLYTSVHYGGSPELLEGLQDALGACRPLVVGTTGDGILERDSAGDVGAAALGLHGEGSVAFRVAVGTGVGADPGGALRRALADLRQEGEPDLALIYSDFRADASGLESVLRDEVAFPVVGGLAADDNRMDRCFLYAGGESLQDAVVLVGLRGRFRFEIAVGNTLTPVGKPGRVEEAQGTQVRRIGGLSAMDFIEGETGKPVLQTDRGILTLEVSDPEGRGERRLRSIVPDFSAGTGHLGLYGGVEAGSSVRVCLADPRDLVAEVRAIAQRARDSGFDPVAALVTSCAGRKWLLGGQIEHEVGALSKAFPGGLAIAGFPSFGEIGPLREGAGYGRNLFHNMTYVLLLLGS